MGRVDIGSSAGDRLHTGERGGEGGEPDTKTCGAKSKVKHAAHSSQCTAHDAPHASPLANHSHTRIHALLKYNFGVHIHFVFYEGESVCACLKMRK